MSTGWSLKSAGDRFKAFDLRLRAACVIKPVAPVIQGLGYWVSRSTSVPEFHAINVRCSLTSAKSCSSGQFWTLASAPNNIHHPTLSTCTHECSGSCISCTCIYMEICMHSVVTPSDSLSSQASGAVTPRNDNNVIGVFILFCFQFNVARRWSPPALKAARGFRGKRNRVCSCSHCVFLNLRGLNNERNVTLN